MQLKEAEERLLDTKCKLARLRGQHDGSGSSGTQSKHSVSDRPPSKQKVFVPLLSDHGRNDSEGAGQAGSQASKAIILYKKSLERTATRLNLGIYVLLAHDIFYILGLYLCIYLSIHSVLTYRLFTLSGLGDHKDLIPLIRSNPSPSIFRWQTSSQISNLHRRRMRSISLCPVDDKLFATRC